MPRVVANFDVEIPGFCLVGWPEGQDMTFDCTIDDFGIRLQLLPDEYWRTKLESDRYWTRGIERVLVAVSREEGELPPYLEPDEEGRLNYAIQSDYFKNRTADFGRAACEAINRFIRFFRYSLHTPLLQELEPSHQYFRNARWTNEKNEEVGKAGVVIVAQRIPGVGGELGVQKLTPENSRSLSDFLKNPNQFSLFDELLSDAQSAWFAENLRRSILELAIGCEVAVKRRFFSEDSPAGAAFDYLEDKSQIKVRVLELVDRIATEAFGKSFRIDHPTDYRNIDHLLRCRNKVAHRGELAYRNDGGIEVPVDSGLVREWWHSVLILRDWLYNTQETEQDDF